MGAGRRALSALLMTAVIVSVTCEQSEAVIESTATTEETATAAEASSAESLITKEANDTSTSSESSEGTSTRPTTGSKVECDIRTSDASADSEGTAAGVRLVNSTEILEFLDLVPNTTRSRCAVVLFYYASCVFSCNAAPHFNALGRLFPQIHVLALDAYSHNGINMRFGLVGVPTILFFHNSKIVAKFNDSDPVIENLVSFVNRVTGLSPAGPGSLEITDEDRAGPVPSVMETRFDYVLFFSWVFVLTCFSNFVLKSAEFKRLTEYVLNNWREAEAQHEHHE